MMYFLLLKVIAWRLHPSPYIQVVQLVQLDWDNSKIKKLLQGFKDFIF
jgi:hypothetical protein